MTITAEKLVRAGLADQATAEKVAPALNEACSRFGINTGSRIAGFLAQCAHESCKFRAVEENLRYTAAALQKVWPKRFDAATAASYAKQPERIANRAYASRIGNGNEASGDGWRYRGRGFIQLTGRSNYQAFGVAIGEDVLSHPEKVAEPKYAALSAAWFWSTKNLNEVADRVDGDELAKAVNAHHHDELGDFDWEDSLRKSLGVDFAAREALEDAVVEDETKVVNGGTLGLEERRAFFEAAQQVFG